MMTLKTMLNQRLALSAMTAAVIMMTACSSDEVLDGDAVQNPDNAVTFGTYLTTRAKDLTTEGLKTNGFGVYAYHLTSDLTKATTETGKTLSDTQAPNFMNDQKVVYSGTDNAWTYSPLKYWPGNTDSKISFMAWAPYAKKGAVTLSASAGDPMLTYAPVNTDKGQLSICRTFDLVAAQQYNLTAANQINQVNLKFKHTLSRLNINVKAGDIYYKESDAALRTKILVKKVTLSGSKCYTSGQLNLSSGLWASRTAATSAFSLDSIMRKDIALGENTDKHSLFNADYTESSSMEYLYMIPSTATAISGTDTDGDITVTFDIDIVSYDKNLASGYTTQSETRTVTVSQQLVQSLSYNWNFTILLSGIKFDATVEDWTDAPDQPNTGDSNSNSGNVDQYINEEYYLCSNSKFSWSLPNSYGFTYSGSGLFTLTLGKNETLEDFLIVDKNYNMYGITRTTKEIAYSEGAQLKLNDTKAHQLTHGDRYSNIHYIWINDNLNIQEFYKVEKADNFTGVTLTFDPANCTVKVTKDIDE